MEFTVGDIIYTEDEEPLTITKVADDGYYSEDLLICRFKDENEWKLINN